jgi:hypothetical protein
MIPWDVKVRGGSEAELILRNKCKKNNEDQFKLAGALSGAY